MFSVPLPQIGTAAAWRDAARRALSNRICPEQIDWRWNASPTDAVTQPLPPCGKRPLRLPKGTLELTDGAIWHRDPGRFDLAYRHLFRVSSNRHSAQDPTQTVSRTLGQMRSAVMRCRETMLHGSRFRRLGTTETQPVFGAFSDPAHQVLEMAAPHFARRLEDLTWIILTPDLAAYGRNGGHHISVPSALPDWAARAAEELQAHEATSSAGTTAEHPNRQIDLFAEPLPLQRRPNGKSEDRVARRPGRARSRVLHEPGLGGSTTSE